VLQKAPAAQVIRESRTALSAMMPIFRPGVNASVGSERSIKVMCLLLVNSSSENGSFTFPIAMNLPYDFCPLQDAAVVLF
jgi:hypothetical protein